MKTVKEARAILAAAHTVLPFANVAAHAVELAGVVAHQDFIITELCKAITTLTGASPPYVHVETAWPEVYNAGVAHD